MNYIARFRYKNGNIEKRHVFSTKEEAISFCQRLFLVITFIGNWKVEETPYPVTHTFKNNKLEPVPEDKTPFRLRLVE